MSDVQISAYISRSAKDQMERYVAAHGLKKGAFIEQALLYHLRALNELPDDIAIPPRLVLSGDDFDALVERVQIPADPTEAMRALMAGEGEEPPATSA